MFKIKFTIYLFIVKLPWLVEHSTDIHAEIEESHKTDELLQHMSSCLSKFSCSQWSIIYNSPI